MASCFNLAAPKNVVRVSRFVFVLRQELELLAS
jgi:hypothetical protein